MWLEIWIEAAVILGIVAVVGIITAGIGARNDKNL